MLVCISHSYIISFIHKGKRPQTPGGGCLGGFDRDLHRPFRGVKNITWLWWSPARASCVTNSSTLVGKFAVTKVPVDWRQSHVWPLCHRPQSSWAGELTQRCQLYYKGCWMVRHDSTLDMLRQIGLRNGPLQGMYIATCTVRKLQIIFKCCIKF